MPVASSKKFLEIGGGAGLVSIVAAAWGHDITLTESNPDLAVVMRSCLMLMLFSIVFFSLGWWKLRSSF